MSDEKKQPEDQDEDRPDVEEVVSEFNNGIRVRSGFEIEEVEPGQIGISIFGPIFDFLDDDDPEDLESDDEADDQD